MAEKVKIADVVRIKEFAPVIELDMAKKPKLYRQLVDQYIVTEDLADLFVRILSSPLMTTGAVMSEVLNRRAHLITAQYGSGKTYFLLMLASVLESLGNPEKFAQTQTKFSGFPNVLSILQQLKGKKFLVIRLNAKGHGDIPLKELLVRSLRDAAIQIKPDLVLESEYTAAADNLKKLKGTRAGQLFEEELQKAEGISLDSLRDGLIDLHYESLTIYREIYERVFKSAPSRTGLDLEKSFLSTLDQLKDEGYTNIAVLADEMTQYLQSSTHYFPLTDTFGVLENFAEFCNIGSNQCMFVGAMHRSLRRILQERGINPDEKEDWRKFLERFDDHDIQFSDYERLLERVFEISPRLDEHIKTPIIRYQIANLKTVARKYAGLESGARVPVSSFFPLHPATLRYLRGVSDRLGQEKRTAFSFIKDHVKAVLAREDLIVDGRLNVIGPDELFDYFLPDLQQADEVGIIYAYNTARARLAQDNLAMRIFKALAMQYCAYTVTGLRAPEVIEQGMTLSALADVLNVTDEAQLRASLDLILRIRPQSVFFDQDTEQYWFVPGGGEWNIDNEISKIIDQFNPNEELRKELKRLDQRIVFNQPGSIDVIVPRSIESEWQGTTWLMGQSEVSKRKEGKFVFVVPEFVESYDKLPPSLEEKAKDLACRGVCIVLPKSSAMLSPQDLREIAALRKLEKREEVVSSAQNTRIVKTRLTNVAERVERALLQFANIKNLLFYIEGRQVPVKDFEEAARRLFAALYPRFPKVRMERISGRGVTNKVINTLIATKTRTIPDAEQSEDARFIREALPAMGLVKLTPTANGKIATLAAPRTGERGYGIWAAMERTLKKRRSFKEFNLTLQGPPYGLPDFMREVYLAAYLAFKRIAVRNIKENRFETTVSARLVKDIVSKGKKAYEIFDITGGIDALRPFVLDVWRVVEDAQGQRHYRNINVTVQGDHAVWHNSIRPALRSYAGGQLTQAIDALAEINGPLKSLANMEIEDSYLRNLRDGLLEVATSLDYMTPESGYQKVLELCQVLSGDGSAEGGEVTPDQAFYRFRQIVNNCKTFVEDEQANGRIVATCIKTIAEIRDLVEGTIAEQHINACQAAADALKVCCTNIFDPQGRQRFVDSVSEMWKGYAQEHVTEHDIVVDLRKSFGQRLLASTEYFLLKELDSLEFGLLKAADISAAVNDVRQQACKKLGEVPAFPQTRCPKCKEFYLVGSSQEVSKDLKAKETELSESLQGAVRGYLVGIRGYAEKEGFSDYLDKRGNKNFWQQFMALDLSSETLDLQQILLMAPIFVAVVKDFEKHIRVPPVTRISVDTLVQSLGEFFSSHGISELSYSELKNNVERWLTQVRRSYYK
jgi:hypothetical protein